MLGQQQQQMVAEKEAGGALRRMILALTVAALMVAMMVATAAPAFANQGRGGGSVENDYNSPSGTGWYKGGATNGGDNLNDINGNKGQRNGDWRN